MLPIKSECVIKVIEERVASYVQCNILYHLQITSTFRMHKGTRSERKNTLDFFHPAK
jgi:hypothetical protein